MSAKYEQDPADPVIEEIATSLAEKWTMAMFFFLVTRDGIEQLVEWAMESSYLDGVMEAPKGILASFCANQWAHEFFYAVKSATEPFQEEQKWCVQLKVQGVLCWRAQHRTGFHPRLYQGGPRVAD